MSLGHHGIVQQEEAHCEGAGDADLSNERSSCSSPRSTRSRASKDYSTAFEGSADEDEDEDEDKDEDEDDGDHCRDKNSLPSPVKKQSSKTLKAQRRSQKKGGHHHLKQSHAAKNKALMFPPIKRLEGSNQRIRSARMHQIKVLSSKVEELQQQLREVTTENRLLKQLQGRHTVALQHYQDSQSSLPQVLLKHSSEVRAQQEQLRRARVQRDGLARHLQAAEDELRCTKHALQHLQALSQDQHLGEREELSHRLALATARLERTARRTQDLERNLELSQAFFKRQIATATRKANEARELSDSLDEQISQLTQKVKERERELEINNIYSHRFPKGWNKKESKAVQTDAVSPVPIEDPSCPVESEHPNAETQLDTQEHLVGWESFGIDDTEVAADQSDDESAVDKEDSVDEQDDRSEKKDLPLEGDGCPAGEEGIAPQATDGEQTEERDRVGDSLEDLHNTEHLAGKALDSPSRTRRHYTFKETIQNLHRGKPAYSSPSLRRSPPKLTDGQARFHNLGSGAYQPSFVPLPAGRRPRPDTPIRSKKSSLMKELFGQGEITKALPGQTGGSKGLSADLDSRSSYHMGDASPISPERETNILFF